MELPTSHGPLVDKAKAAELLGISLDTLRKWIRARRIPVVKMGDSKQSAIRLRVADIDAFILKRLVPAIAVKEGR